MLYTKLSTLIIIKECLDLKYHSEYNVRLFPTPNPREHPGNFIFFCYKIEMNIFYLHLYIMFIEITIVIKNRQ